MRSPNHQCHQFTSNPSRRDWLRTTGCGFGALAFSAFAQQIASAATVSPHHTPRAKRVIFLFMHGGVSHVDSFDPKPKLKEYNGQPLPFKGLDTLDIALKKAAAKCSTQFGISNSTAKAVLGSAISGPIFPNMPTTCALSNRCTRGALPTVKPLP